MKMWKLTVRQIRTRPGRAFLTVLSIVIGVAAVVAVSQATTATRQAYDQMFKAITGKADLEISSTGDVGVDEQLVEEIEKLPGVLAAVPLLQRQIRVSFRAADGQGEPKPGGTEPTTPDDNPDDQPAAEEWRGFHLQVLGIDPQRDHFVREFDVVEFEPGSWIDPKFQRAKSAPEKNQATATDAAVKPGEETVDDEDRNKGVVLDAQFAKSQGLKLDDPVRLTTRKRGAVVRHIVGLVSPRGAAATKQAGLAFLELSNAQELIVGGDAVDLIQVVLNPKVKPSAVMPEIAKLLTEGVNVSTPQANTQQADETMLSTEQGLNLATGLSLVVSIFIVLNTFLMNVAERRRQLSIMRAIGATRRQIMRLMLGEGILLGMVGTIIGIVVGLFGAYWLSGAMSSLMQAAQPAVAITWTPILKGTVFGLGVAFTATYVPAWLASKLTPLEGMGAVAPEDRAQGAPKVLTGIALLMLIASAIVLTGTVLGRISNDVSVPAAMTALVACVCLIPAVLTPVSTLIRNALSPILGIEGNLAHRQILRRRVRTTLTVGVLFVALAMGAGMGTSILNSTEDVRQWFDRTVVGHFFIRAMMPNMGKSTTADVPDEMYAQLQQVPGVTEVRRVRCVRSMLVPKTTEQSGAPAHVPAEANERSAPIAADSSAPVAADSSGAEVQVTVVVREIERNKKVALDLKLGDENHLANQMCDGRVVVGSVLAQRQHITLGDSITLRTPEGPREFSVAGIANDYAFGGITVGMERAVGVKLFKVSGADAYTVFGERDRLDEIQPKLEKLCQKNGVILQSWAKFSDVVNGMMNGVVSMLWALLVIGFIAASFGIVNTLTMNVLEQTRELGMLRVVAMTRAQVRKAIISQAALMGLMGLAPGALIGLIVAYIMNLASKAVVGHDIEFSIDPKFIVGSFVGAVVIVLIAAWLPARRATQLKLTEALHYE